MKPISIPPIWLLATMTLASPFAMNVFNPAMPDVVRAFDTTIDVVQLTLTLYLLALGRVLQALGGGAILVLVRTMIMDAYTRNEAGGLLSYITMAVAVAQTVAPTVGGYLNHYLKSQTVVVH